MRDNTFQRHALAPQFFLRAEAEPELAGEAGGYIGPILVGKVIFYVLWSNHKIAKLYFSFAGDFEEDQNQRGRQTAIIDVLCLFAQGRSRPSLARLELREIENYLRTKPQEPLWPPSLLAEMNDWFKELKMGFLGELEIKLMQGRQDVQCALKEAIPLSQYQWEISDMITRIRWVEQNLERFIRPILAADGGGVALIDVDNDSLVIAFKGECGNCAGGRKGTLQFIQSFFHSLPGDCVKLKVVDEMPIIEAF